MQQIFMYFDKVQHDFFINLCIKTFKIIVCNVNNIQYVNNVNQLNLETETVNNSLKVLGINMYSPHDYSICYT